MSGDQLDLDAIVEHYSSWYGNADNDSPNSAIESGWSLADYGETLSHYIVREDVPALVAEVRRLRARLDAVNTYADEVVRPKNLWMALDIRCATSDTRVVFAEESAG